MGLGIVALLSTIPTWGLDAEVAVPAGLLLLGSGIAEATKAKR